MVGLRCGFFPRVTDVISRTSEVRLKIFECILSILHLINNFLVQKFVKFVKNDTFSNFLLIQTFILYAYLLWFS